MALSRRVGGAASRESAHQNPSHIGAAPQQVFDFIFKFIIIGNAGVGKSCILHQLIENRFSKGSTHTIGVEFGSKTCIIDGKTINLQIWDTAGQERYRSVTRSYYRGAAGALIVYDITDRESYDHAVQWLADARTLARPDIAVICIGNKNDLRAQRHVTFLEASRFAQENEVLFLETSALSGEGVEAAFVKVAKSVLNRIDEGLMDPSAFSPLSIGGARGSSAVQMNSSDGRRSSKEEASSASGCSC